MLVAINIPKEKSEALKLKSLYSAFAFGVHRTGPVLTVAEIRVLGRQGDGWVAEHYLCVGLWEAASPFLTLLRVLRLHITVLKLILSSIFF